MNLTWIINVVDKDGSTAGIQFHIENNSVLLTGERLGSIDADKLGTTTSVGTHVYVHLM